MALINCPECNGLVSSRAEICVHCGYPLSKPYDKEEDVECNSAFYKIRMLKLGTGDVQQDAILNTVFLTGLSIPNARKLIEGNYTPIIIAGLNIEDANRVKDIYANDGIEVNIEPDNDSKERTILSIKDKTLRAENYNKPKQDVVDFLFCPKCRATLIDTVGISSYFGGYPRNICQKCGYQWKPGAYS